MLITYHELELRYGGPLAHQYLIEMERAAKIAANDDSADFEERIARAQRIQDQQRKV